MDSSKISNSAEKIVLALSDCDKIQFSNVDHLSRMLELEPVEAARYIGRNDYNAIHFYPLVTALQQMPNAIKPHQLMIVSPAAQKKLTDKLRGR